MDIDRAEYPLHPVHIDTWEGHIFLNFSNDPWSLAEQLAPLTAAFAPWRMAELKLHHRITTMSASTAPRSTLG
jgi:phenylpropionate dioxygenase-like ring-hydroxylating dioxygenase large terminal subunit